ncbi:hypothetical protein PAXRUDRAFT_244710 [Paxillus rubicundulus Ve08.2h10]|uniref:Uncharacterized protein n=1 Tax=Paxillus rubicundulus Ve08.2h10 TaxID=930991 RepID=A0A0D0E0X1_9AGAM|nr:hypothetical protein PAXRUDRAFT_244710 [Paxillus rubicundulus Ve08.2h10]
MIERRLRRGQRYVIRRPALMLITVITAFIPTFSFSGLVIPPHLPNVLSVRCPASRPHAVHLQSTLLTAVSSQARSWRDIRSRPMAHRVSQQPHHHLPDDLHSHFLTPLQ